MARMVSHITGLYLIAGICGLVDAACFLSLGEVFAEMMTGNLLLFCFFVGTGHPIFQHAVYLIALGAFALGAIAGGRIVRSAHGHTRLGFAVEWVFLAAATLLSVILDAGSSGTARDVVISLLAFAMGMQNALLAPPRRARSGDQCHDPDPDGAGRGIELSRAARTSAGSAASARSGSSCSAP